MLLERLEVRPLVYPLKMDAARGNGDGDLMFAY